MRSAATAALAAAALAAATATPAAAATCVERKAPVKTGLTERARSVDGRVVTLTLRSTAMGDDQIVNVLLPKRYDPSGRTRYPVLYLLHGAGGDNRTWLDSDEAAQALGSTPVIAVMPDGSQTTPGGDRQNGGYSDWFGRAAGSDDPIPAWESFHVRELVPFVDRTFPTRASAGGRAIAGISMGGTGAMKYAGEFPGTFGYAGSLSGGLDPSIDGREKGCKWGERPQDEVVWRDNNPTDLAANLRGVRLFVRAGDGKPGPFDAPAAPADPAAAAVWQTRLATEAGAHLMAENFLASLDRAGVFDIDADYYAGSHSHPYWQREFRNYVAWLRTQLRNPVTAPRSISVASAHATLNAWGWSLQTHRKVREFVYLKTTGTTGLTATGSGTLDVVTPAVYKHGRRYVVRTGSASRRLRADRAGRLRFSVDLGPSHTAQQSDFGADATKGWRSASVRIKPE
jgi:diacylglycerol O-acyltransferase/trehalose O-mycolyltransferase